MLLLHSKPEQSSSRVLEGHKWHYLISCCAYMQVHLCIPQLLASDEAARHTVELGPVNKFAGNPLFGEFGSKGGKPWELAWFALAWSTLSISWVCLRLIFIGVHSGGTRTQRLHGTRLHPNLRCGECCALGCASALWARLCARKQVQWFRQLLRPAPRILPVSRNFARHFDTLVAGIYAI